MNNEVARAEIERGESQLADVRTLEEWEAGHAMHAIHVPVDTLLLGAPHPFSRDKKIYTYCLSGGRAGMAAEYLRQQGFDAVSGGGLSDWV